MHAPYQRTGEQAPATAPFPEDPTAATRHLCAAAYLDEDFRAAALREVYLQPHRAIAPSYGFHLVSVLSHCLRARTVAIWRDAAILATFLIMLCAATDAVLTVVFLLTGFHALVATVRLARDLMGGVRAGTSVDLNTLATQSVLLAMLWGAAGTALTLGYAISAYRNLDSINAATASGDLSSLENLDMGPGWFAVLATALLLFGFSIAWGLWVQYELDGLGPGRTPSIPRITARLQEIDGQGRGNTVVYSGFRPYVGAGDLVSTWGFAQRLVRPQPDEMTEALVGSYRAPEELRRRQTEGEREFEHAPFSAAELIAQLRAHLTALTFYGNRNAAGPEDLLATMTVTDQVSLAGTEVARPTSTLPPEVVAGVIRFPTTPARHHLACQVVSWGGELVTTVNVHVAVQGRSLYLEVTTTALWPTADPYRVVSSIDGTGPVAWWRALRSAVANTPVTVGRAPGNLLRAAVDAVFGAGRGALRPGLDYGARVGVRELGTRADGGRNLTQYQDVGKYQRLIERRVLAAVLDFLDSRGVDTTEYSNRVTNLNVGGSVYGGSQNNYHNPVGRDANNRSRS
ncbi:hypothetical protein [Actinoplanes regularis]|uniref:hypothetical protein n=1 Tax=Actinoplanes regularis TaxID=52697 RepID=UPI0025532C73|nr:hypothetical protein [Actinoplanes regularis]GLW27929.1 hypothetical protein Areg01_08690 [Actinoplanes regularis]